MLVISIVVKGGESRGGFGSGLRFLCMCCGTGMASGPSGIMAGEGVLSFRAVLWCPVVKDWKVGRWQASFHSPGGCSHLPSLPHKAVGFVICFSGERDRHLWPPRGSAVVPLASGWAFEVQRVSSSHSGKMSVFLLPP